MAQDYDVALKLLFRDSAKSVLRAIAGCEVVQWQDKELPEIRNTRADMIGETADGGLVHFEFESRNRALTELRVAGYYVDLYRTYGKHPVQVLIYVGFEKMTIPDRFETPTMSFRFKIVDLRDLDGEVFLNSEAIGDQILAILMRLKDESVAIRRIVASIAKLAEAERDGAVNQLLVISGLRRLEERVEREIKKVPVLESLMDHKVLGREFKRGRAEGVEEGRAVGVEEGRAVGVEEGRAEGVEEGMEKGEAKILRRQLQKRFGEIPPWAEQRILAATLGELESWADILLDASTIQEVFGL